MKRVCLALAVFPSVYLLGAFIAWDFNPGNWDASARAFVVFFAIWIAAGVAILD
jgi:hypothetical protein